MCLQTLQVEYLPGHFQYHNKATLKHLQGENPFGRMPQRMDGRVVDSERPSASTAPSHSTMNKLTPLSHSRKTPRFEVISFHLRHLDCPSNLPAPAARSTLPCATACPDRHCCGDLGLCGAPAWCLGSWRYPRASTSPLKIKAWLRTLPSQLMLLLMVSLKPPMEVLTLSETGFFQLAHGIFLSKSFLPALPSGRGT